jgi:hypothetical protein
MNRLNQQLEGVKSHLLVCKWPVILTSSCFVTLLSWEMAGDHGGWSNALWVPIVGVVMLAMIWTWDRMLLNGTISISTFRSKRSKSVELAAIHSSLHPSGNLVEHT